LVLLTRTSSWVHTDALCYLDWDGAAARWRGEPATLARDDIGHPVQWFDPKLERPPYIRDVMVTPQGLVLIHQTGSHKLDDGGDAKYGMDWSMIMEVDASTGRSCRIADVAIGIGQFAADGTRLAGRALRSNKLDL